MPVQASSWWQIPNLGHACLPLPGLFGALHTPDCTLLGHQWAERVPKEAGSGGDPGLLSGVLSSSSALPHTHQLPHTLSPTLSCLSLLSLGISRSRKDPVPEAPWLLWPQGGTPPLRSPLYPLLGPPWPPAPHSPQVGAQVQPWPPHPLLLLAKSL